MEEILNRMFNRLVKKEWKSWNRGKTELVTLVGEQVLRDLYVPLSAHKT